MQIKQSSRGLKPCLAFLHIVMGMVLLAAMIAVFDFMRSAHRFLLAGLMLFLIVVFFILIAHMMPPFMFIFCFFAGLHVKHLYPICLENGK